MQRSLPALIALILLFSTVGWSADFQKGLEAYNNKDYRTALRELKPFAEEGYVYAQYYLGLIYANGASVPKNDKTALKWLTLAAKQSPEISYKLGLMYATGKKVPQNDRRALKWYTRAAEQGLAMAQNNLGLRYSNGEGVPKNDVYAYMWFNVSASLGNKLSAKSRDRLAKEMTPSQIEEAQDLASECVEKKYKGCGRPKR